MKSRKSVRGITKNKSKKYLGVGGSDSKSTGGYDADNEKSSSSHVNNNKTTNRMRKSLKIVTPENIMVALIFSGAIGVIAYSLKNIT